MSNEFKFYLCLGGLCLMFPPLFGLVIGVGIFVLTWVFFYKILGG